MTKLQFQQEVRRYYRKSGRELPWRRTEDPYQILISEIMLQQTRVERVTEKYEEFLKAFPDVRSLSKAPTSDVLRAWQGLGYNRRAIYIKRLAETVMEKHEGKLPRDYGALVKLPGIGPATAGALTAFAFNKPVVFIETNIRRAYIHAFFPGGEQVSDTDIRALVEETLDRKHPREWYWALMDYGAMLGALPENPNWRSAHYIRQSKFEGSRRQVRGNIIRELVENGSMTKRELEKRIGRNPLFPEALDSLKREGAVENDRHRLAIAR